MNSAGFVDICGVDECYDPHGGPHRKMRKFYIGDKYCRHMENKYGHETATWEDHYQNYNWEEHNTEL